MTAPFLRPGVARGFVPVERQAGRAENRMALATWTGALASLKSLEESGHRTLLSAIEASAAVFPDRPALIGEERALTYRELVARARSCAVWARRRGVGGGGAIALLMPNCPDYVAIWTGITHVGGVTALLNTSLAGDALVHAIDASATTAAIVDASLRPGIDAIRHRLAPDFEVIEPGEVTGDAGADEHAHDAGPLPDRALLIGTSGTTGLPKAAHVTHARILEWSHWFAGAMDAGPEDRLFNCLPMYHSIGGVVAIGSILLRGGSVLIRRRFSSRDFWADIVENDCTIFQYIGELCRYLATSPADRLETRHHLRLCCGNGLRPEIWERFRTRFAIPRIIEFYAATEGNVSLYNFDGKVGAVGRIPAFLRHRFPVELIRCDPLTGEPLRDPQGMCIRCAPDEAGEAIGRIDATRAFDGYTDRAATERKILGDVFRPADRWFRTGDLMRRDHSGFYHFVDRVGDTFRWKGENVSTSEVASVIGACPGVANVVVTGVAIPGHDGRAGLAAVERTQTLEMATLARHIEANLPAYARPLLIRVCDTIETTGTFKFSKILLTEEGLSIDPSREEVWFYDRRAATLVRCDEDLLCGLRDGSTRL